MIIVPLLKVRKAVRERGYHSNMLTCIGHELTVVDSKGESSNYPSGYYRVQENKHKWPREFCAVVSLAQKRYRFSDITAEEIRKQTTRIIEEFKTLYPESSGRKNRANKVLTSMKVREDEFLKLLINGGIVARPAPPPSMYSPINIREVFKDYKVVEHLYRRAVDISSSSKLALRFHSDGPNLIIEDAVSGTHYSFNRNQIEDDLEEAREQRTGLPRPPNPNESDSDYSPLRGSGSGPYILDEAEDFTEEQMEAMRQGIDVAPIRAARNPSGRGIAEELAEGRRRTRDEFERFYRDTETGEPREVPPERPAPQVPDSMVRHVPSSEVPDWLEPNLDAEELDEGEPGVDSTEDE